MARDGREKSVAVENYSSFASVRMLFEEPFQIGSAIPLWENERLVPRGTFSTFGYFSNPLLFHVEQASLSGNSSEPAAEMQKTP